MFVFVYFYFFLLPSFLRYHPENINISNIEEEEEEEEKKTKKKKEKLKQAVRASTCARIIDPI